ncbi:hypothetical protein MRB53_001955 [Persea americana]|uniref:Uncharacterized protein n=1 Tax=Persea americana TaxID=3435 RepID=A0ACC2MVI2_PERAE|nr:hypothetical protein MRB53_001955 [Persea americana]
MHIAGREKLKYIMGTTPQPKGLLILPMRSGMQKIKRTMLNGEPDHLESFPMMARRSKPQQWRTNPKLERASGPPNHTADQNRSSGSQNRSYEMGVARPKRLCTHVVELDILSHGAMS